MSKKYIFLLKVLVSILLVAHSANGQKKLPNIVWISCEDISPTLSFYKDSTAKTPNLDLLAAQSLIFDNAFATTPVCGPSRSAIITGMLPTSIGTMHMRTGKDVFSWGKNQYLDTVFMRDGSVITDTQGNVIREYSAVVPEQIKCFTEYLRMAGYYCTNNSKTDYQFQAPQSAWDENNQHAHWRNAPDGMPFFAVFNINDTHESKIWEHKHLPLTVDPMAVTIPPYFPENDIIRNDLARHYSNIALMDQQVGQIIKNLKSDGLYDDTIIFFFSDHGGPFPRYKRELLDSGTRVPLIIRLPKSTTSTRVSDLISLVDLGPTTISLAGIKPPKYMDGKPLLGQYKSKLRSHIFGTSDRFDEFTDRSRAVRNKKYLYIKNYNPELPKYKNVAYRLNMPMMLEIIRQKDANMLTKDQQSWFSPKESEELYDCVSDPYQLHNLAKDKNHSSTLKKMRKICEARFDKNFDYGSLPERKMVEIFWPNNVQPTTDTVSLTLKQKQIYLDCATKDASISYIILPKLLANFPDNNEKWKLYSTPIAIPQKAVIYVKAQRIGYKESKILNFHFN